MADEEEGQEERKGGMGRLLAMLAAVGAILAIFAFWRRRRGSDLEDED